MADKEKLPWNLQLENMIMAPGIYFSPIWWLIMLARDARDNRKDKWRIPSLPHMTDYEVPNGKSPKDTMRHLNSIGIKTIMVSLQWTIDSGRICLIHTIFVPGRQKEWTHTALQRYLSGNPVRARKQYVS